MRTILLSAILLLTVTQQLFSQLALAGWHLKDSSEGYRGISLNRAYTLLQGKKSKRVIVAVLDSGIDTTHEDLHHVLWTNPREIAGNGKDDDNNGFIDDIHGWDFTSPSMDSVCTATSGPGYFLGTNNLMNNISSHGTCTSGIIVAERNNGKGIDGIADNACVMMLRVINNNKTHDGEVARAIRYAADNGARVINMSFGNKVSPHKSEVDAAVRYAMAKDVLIVFAAGNDEYDLDRVAQFPTPYYLDSTRAANWITVGAAMNNLTGSPKSSFSNWGQRSVDVFAPGVRIYTTTLGNQYDFGDGTSEAAPVVSGIAVLLRSYFPGLTAAQVKEAIEASVIKVERLKKYCRTGGVVNAYEAVQYAMRY